MKNKKFKYGMSMAEIGLSIVLLSTVVLIIIGMFIGGITGVKKGDKLILATNVAQAIIEFYSQEHITNFSSYDPNTYIQKALDPVNTENLTFQREIKIQEISGYADTNRLKKLTAKVTWYEKNIKKEIELNTYITNYNE